MTRVIAPDAVFKIDDTGGQIRDLSTYITRVRGLPGPRKVVRVTGLGEAGQKWTPGLQEGEFIVEGEYDNTATSGPDAVLGPLRTHTSPVDFEFGPHGGETGEVKYSGTCWVEDYWVDVHNPTTGPNLVKWQAKFKVEGAVTRGTFP